MKKSNLENITDSKERLPGHGSSDIGLPVIKKNEIQANGQWIVDLHLGKNEITGPLLLVISQPLQYKVINDRPGFITNTPITGDELAAIVEKIPKKTRLTIVFGDGQNSYRYQVIDAISMNHPDEKNLLPEFSDNNVDEQILFRKHALADGEKWLAENDALIEKWRQEGRTVTVSLASNIMYQEDCQSLYKTMYNDHKNLNATGEYKDLQDVFNKFANAAVLALYPDLICTINAGFKFYHSKTGELFSKEKIEKILTDSTLGYIIHEFAMTVKLAATTQARFLLYKQRDKNRHKGKFSNQLNFVQFAPQLIYLAMKLYADTSQQQLLYREFSSIYGLNRTITSENKKQDSEKLKITKLTYELILVSFDHISKIISENPSIVPLMGMQGSNPDGISSSNLSTSSECSISSDHKINSADEEDDKQFINLSIKDYNLLCETAISNFKRKTREDLIKDFKINEKVSDTPTIQLTFETYKMLRRITLSDDSLTRRKKFLSILHKHGELPNVVPEKKQTAKFPQASRTDPSCLPFSKQSYRFFDKHRQSSLLLPKNTRYKNRVFEWRPKAGFKIKEPIKPGVSARGDFLLR